MDVTDLGVLLGSADGTKGFKLNLLDESTFEVKDSFTLQSQEWGVSLSQVVFSGDPTVYIVLGTALVDPAEEDVKNVSSPHFILLVDLTSISSGLFLASCVAPVLKSPRSASCITSRLSFLLVVMLSHSERATDLLREPRTYWPCNL